MKRAKRKYIKKNFALYRLSGMMGNLAHMRYEFRDNAELYLKIERAMDSIHCLKTFLKEGEKEPSEIISISEAYDKLSIGFPSPIPPTKPYHQ